MDWHLTSFTKLMKFSCILPQLPSRHVAHVIPTNCYCINNLKDLNIKNRAIRSLHISSFVIVKTDNAHWEPEINEMCTVVSSYSLTVTLKRSQKHLVVFSKKLPEISEKFTTKMFTIAKTFISSGFCQTVLDTFIFPLKETHSNFCITKL